MDAAAVFEKIASAVRAVENLPYDGEAVDQLQYALQCAALAREGGHGPEVVVAALLHDVGRSPVALKDLRDAGVTGSEHGHLAGAWLRPLVGEEVWEFVTDVHHPVHLHLVYFRVLSRQGQRPLRKDAGWKDTVDLPPGQVARVLCRFEGYRGRYVFHCHNLEHEDMMMMANFEVV